MYALGSSQVFPMVRSRRASVREHVEGTNIHRKSERARIWNAQMASKHILFLLALVENNVLLSGWLPITFICCVIEGVKMKSTVSD